VSVVALPPDVAQAVELLQEAFPGRIHIEAYESPGPIVRITDVVLGPGWSAHAGELWCSIPFHYPDAAIYPYYATGAVPAAGVGGGALQPVGWRGMAATQVSLRHNAWDPSRDTAVGSVMQTLAWLQAS